MKKILVFVQILALMFFSGCYKRWTETDVKVVAANWTSDNKVVFVKEVIVWEITKILPFIAERADVKSDEFWLYEISHDGTGLREICYLWDRPGGIGGLSSAGDWIVFSDNIYQEIYVIRRDGTGLEKVGEGLNPDFSPDASKIVYEKPGKGIWIMDRDGTGDHCIVPDSSAKYPAWSPDGGKIAYVRGQLYLADTTGDIVDSLGPWKQMPDWTASDTSKLIAYIPGLGNGLVITISTHAIDTLDIKTGDGAGFKWSPNGKQIIGHDENGWYVININGTNKWYIKAKI